MVVTEVAEIQLFYKAFPGNDCPRCQKVSSMISTTNDWRFHCRSCDIRFNDRGEVLVGSGEAI